jgi:hypothetical protein
MVSYMRHCGKRADNDYSDPQVAAVAAGSAYTRFIEERLLSAIKDGYACQGRPVSGAAARRLARGINAAPDRRSYIAIADGSPLGHLTMLTDASDQVTGEDYIDLVDMLADPGELASRARTVLVRAAVAFAATARKPLIGSVVHGSSGPTAGQQVVDSLLKRGWHVDRADWWWSEPWPQRRLRS